MSKEKQARIKLLDMQLEAAAVEKADEEGYFNVFVPGAYREHNTVTADDEEAAKQKVRTFLIHKMEQADLSQADVQVQPDNVKIDPKVKE